MYLPNVEDAIVAESKIAKYLLDPSHKDGGPKAKFYAYFGFRQDEWQVFAEAVRTQAREQEITSVEKSDTYGTYYIIVGHLSSPDGRNPRVRSVWLVDVGETIPRLISVVPFARGKRYGKNP